MGRFVLSARIGRAGRHSSGQATMILARLTPNGDRLGLLRLQQPTQVMRRGWKVRKLAESHTAASDTKTHLAALSWALAGRPFHVDVALLRVMPDCVSAGRESA